MESIIFLEPKLSSAMKIGRGMSTYACLKSVCFSSSYLFMWNGREAVSQARVIVENRRMCYEQKLKAEIMTVAPIHNSHRTW